VAQIGANTLVSAPSLHLLSASTSADQSIVTALSSSCGPTNFVPVKPDAKTSTTVTRGDTMCTGMGSAYYVETTRHFEQDAVWDATSATYIFGEAHQVGDPSDQTVFVESDACAVGASVAASVTPHNQTCTGDLGAGHLTAGFIHVGVQTGLVYSIVDATNHESVAYDHESGDTGPLAPGGYTVTPGVTEGFELANPGDVPAPVLAYSGACGQFVTLALVDPSVVEARIGCTTGGSYTLTSDQQDPLAVTWTVNGASVAAGTYSVVAAGRYVIDAVPGPGFGFDATAPSHWVLSFGPPTTCALATLALTGGDPTGPLVVAGFLLLFGLALTRRTARPW
jgi:hypothetical protein